MEPTASEVSRESRSNKYLVRWNLKLGPEELQRLSARPEALQKGLDYVRRITREHGLEVYRIVPVEEITHRVRPGELPNKSASPSGIAIVKASSLEEVGRLMERWAEGFTYGGSSVPVKGYLEYEINPLVEIVQGGRGVAP
jgi:hypothetical protein